MARRVARVALDAPVKILLFAHPPRRVAGEAVDAAKRVGDGENAALNVIAERQCAAFRIADRFKHAERAIAVAPGAPLAIAHRGELALPVKGAGDGDAIRSCHFCSHIKPARRSGIGAPCHPAQRIGRRNQPVESVVFEACDMALRVGNRGQPVELIPGPAFRRAIGKLRFDDPALVIARQPCRVPFRVGLGNHIGAEVVLIGLAVARAIDDDVEFAIIAPAIDGRAPFRVGEFFDIAPDVIARGAGIAVRVARAGAETVAVIAVRDYAAQRVDFSGDVFIVSRIGSAAPQPLCRPADRRFRPRGSQTGHHSRCRWFWCG